MHLQSEGIEINKRKKYIYYLGSGFFKQRIQFIAFVYLSPVASLMCFAEIQAFKDIHTQLSSIFDKLSCLKQQAFSKAHASFLVR
jgi:hypothetical protein